MRTIPCQRERERTCIKRKLVLGINDNLLNFVIQKYTCAGVKEKFGKLKQIIGFKKTLICLVYKRPL